MVGNCLEKSHLNDQTDLGHPGPGEEVGATVQTPSPGGLVLGTQGSLVEGCVSSVFFQTQSLSPQKVLRFISHPHLPVVWASQGLGKHGSPLLLMTLLSLVSFCCSLGCWYNSLE